MSAIAGPWPAFATELKNKYLGNNGGLLEYLNLNTNRASDFLLMAQCICGLQVWPGTHTFGSVEVEKFLARVDPPTERFKTRVRATFDKYLELSPSLGKQRLAPVEFVMICLLVANHADEPKAAITEHIEHFRKSIKAAHVDLRTNSKVLRTGYELVHSA